MTLAAAAIGTTGIYNYRTAEKFMAAAAGNFGWFRGEPIFFGGGGGSRFSWRRRLGSAAEGLSEATQSLMS